MTLYRAALLLALLPPTVFGQRPSTIDPRLSIDQRLRTNDQRPTTSLWFRQPAATWNEAPPIGSGRLGAMVFGGVDEEHLIALPTSKLLAWKRVVSLVGPGLSIAAVPGLRAQTEQTRESWQRVSDLFGAAGVRAGAAVADVGSGDGFLTVRLSPAVGPSGKVYAVDVDGKVVDTLRQRVIAAGMENVAVVLGADDDPHLPINSLDGAIIVNAYHEMPQGVAILQHIFRALKPGAHLVLCEPVPREPGQSRASQMEHHVLDPALIVDDLRAATFRVIERRDTFVTNLGGTRFGLIVAARP